MRSSFTLFLVTLIALLALFTSSTTALPGFANVDRRFHLAARNSPQDLYERAGASMKRAKRSLGLSKRAKKGGGGGGGTDAGADDSAAPRVTVGMGMMAVVVGVVAVAL